MKTKENTGFAALRAQLKRERDRAGRLEVELNELRERAQKLDAELKTLCSAQSIYERARNDEDVKNKIISEYLMSFETLKNPALITTGVTALTPVNRPKNLADAKRLADKIIKS